MGSLKRIIMNLLFGDTLEHHTTDYHTLLTKVNQQKSKTNELIIRTTEHIKNLKLKTDHFSKCDSDNFEINHQIIRLQSRLEELKHQLVELEKISEKINTAILEDKIQASALENYQIELELTQIK
jgi:predicted RNase H-like nuclease (RuvC/YqgF family)